MAGSAAEWLGENQWFNFHDPAREVTRAYAAYVGEVSDQDPAVIESYTQLTAAEVALTPFFARAALDRLARLASMTLEPRPAVHAFDQQALPVPVSAQHALAAVIRSDCAFVPHKAKQPSDLQLWDVFEYAGDMSKAEMLGFDDVSQLAEQDIMEKFVGQLEATLSDSGLGPDLVESGLVALQSALWFGKVVLLKGGSFTDMASLRVRLPQIA